MSKNIDFGKLQVGTKKQVKKTEILSEETLTEALETIHEMNEKDKTKEPTRKEIPQKTSKVEPEKLTWTKRNCVDMPRDIYIRARNRSLDEQKPMYQFILDCVTDYLDRVEPEDL